MKLRCIILEAEGESAVQHLLSVLPLQFSPSLAQNETPHITEITAEAPTPQKRLGKEVILLKAKNGTGAAPTQERGPKWSIYPRRVARRDLPECRLCPRAITIGESYVDGGQPSVRAHQACVEKLEKAQT